MENINIVFIDNNPKLVKDHLEMLCELLNELSCEGVSKDDNKVIFDLGECHISVTSKILEFSKNPKDNSIPGEIKRDVIKLSNEFEDKKTLFVIDLCLDKSQEDGITGMLVKDVLINKQTKFRHDFLYITAVLSLMDDENTLIRSVTTDDKLDNSIFARTICKFYPNSEAEEQSFSEHYSDILKLMRSKYLNKQLYGAILFKAIKLAK